jgi:hypothetical protein
MFQGAAEPRRTALHPGSVCGDRGCDRVRRRRCGGAVGIAGEIDPLEVAPARLATLGARVHTDIRLSAAERREAG